MQDSVTSGYSGTPLPKKLGIRGESRIALLGAPDGFMSTLGDLPYGVKVRTKAGRPRGRRCGYESVRNR